MLAGLCDLRQFRLRAGERVATERTRRAEALVRARADQLNGVARVAALRLLHIGRQLVERLLALLHRHEADDTTLATCRCDFFVGTTLLAGLDDGVEVDTLRLREPL